MPQIRYGLIQADDLAGIDRQGARSAKVARRHEPRRENAMADSVGIVRSVYDAFGRGDVQTVLGLMSEKVEWNEAEHFPYWPGSAFIGPQAVLNGVFARIGQDFD